MSSPPNQQSQVQQPRWPQSRPVQQASTTHQPQYQQQPQYQEQPLYQQQQYQTPQKQQQQSQASPQQQYNQQPVGVRIEIRTKPYDESESEERKTNAVYVTQPLVFQHPGPGQGANQQHRQVVDVQGARVIPLQVEGSEPRTPSTPR